MSAVIKVSDLSIEDFKILIKKTIRETLHEFISREIDDDDQAELETMFGKTPTSEYPVYEREIEI
ncbi:MAG: hypothetical protein HQK77_04875 [Desulfobacterales bacterium]|nr:hypothetical protein [Desulfobacterales bacterium]